MTNEPGPPLPAWVAVVHAASRTLGVAAEGLILLSIGVICHMVFVRAVLGQSSVLCTLSPVPGLALARQALLEACAGQLDALASAEAMRALAPPAAQALQRLASLYLVHASTGTGGDPVARFHLDNGARLERLNPLGDLSAKGLRQSFGMMVNYLYDLDKVEANHEQFVQGTVAHSRQIAAWL